MHRSITANCTFLVKIDASWIQVNSMVYTCKLGPTLIPTYAHEIINFYAHVTTRSENFTKNFNTQCLPEHCAFKANLKECLKKNPYWLSNGVVTGLPTGVVTLKKPPNGNNLTFVISTLAGSPRIEPSCCS